MLAKHCERTFVRTFAFADVERSRDVDCDRTVYADGPRALPDALVKVHERCAVTDVRRRTKHGFGVDGVAWRLVTIRSREKKNYFERTTT